MAFTLPAFVTDNSPQVAGTLRLPVSVTDNSQSNAGIRLPVNITDNSPQVAGAIRLPQFVVADILNFAYNPTGGVLVGGRASIVGQPDIQPTGGVLVGGSASVTAVQVNVTDFYPRGGVIVGGSAAIKDNLPYRPLGGVLVGGSTPVVFRSNAPYIPTGGVFVGGTAPVVYTKVNIYTVSQDGTPSGGVLVSGAAIILERINFIPSGGALISGTAIILEAIPVNPAGGVLVGGTAPVSVISIITPTGGVLVSGSAPNSFASVHVPTGGVLASGSATILDYQAFYQPSGGVLIGGSAVSYVLYSGDVLTVENPNNDDFAGWSVNLETNATTRYEKLPANSFAQLNGVTYVANAAGIYAYGGDTDAGQPIKASITLPRTDYGTQMDKRIHYMFIGARNASKLRLVVNTSNADRQYYSIKPTTVSMVSTRVKLGQGIRGRYWQFGLTNIDGGDFELESMSFTPALQSRHGR